MKLSKKQKKALKIIGWSLFGASALVTAREVYLTFGPNREARRQLYEAAFIKAIELGKPLIVLGDPNGGVIHRLLGRDFQCGAICIDPRGCGDCPANVTVIADDPIHALAAMQTGSAVIYDSGLFAFTDDGYALANQMLRVSNGNLYMFDVSPWSLTAFFEAKRKRRVLKTPPASTVLSWKTGLLTKEPQTGTRTGEVAIGQLGPVRGLGYTPQPHMHHYERLVSRPAPFTYFTM